MNNFGTPSNNQGCEVPTSFSFPFNFQHLKIKTECLCGEAENMEHLYECNTLNENESILPYQKLYCGNINEQIQVFKRVEKKHGKETRTKKFWRKIAM